MERHCCLAGAGRSLHDRHTGAGATYHDVLLGLDRRYDVVHATAPRHVERGHERTLAHELQPGVAGGGDVEDFVVERGQLALPPTEVASPHDAHGVLRQGSVERLRRGRPPVDDERVAVLVGNGQAAHVEAGAIGEVEATDEQTVLCDVERGQPVAGVGDGAVALEQCLRAPAPGEPGRAGHALGRSPHGHDPVVGGIEVGALAAELIVTQHAGDRRCGRRWKQATRQS